MKWLPELDPAAIGERVIRVANAAMVIVTLPPDCGDGRMALAWVTVILAVRDCCRGR